MTPTSPTVDLQKRQLWALPTPSATSSAGICKNFTLPSGGSLVINSSSTIFFTSNVVYQPPCSGSPAFINSADNGTEPIDGSGKPFYTSITPLVYVVALTTAMAWLLLIALLMFQPSYHGLSTRHMVRAWRRGDGLFSLITSRSSPFPLGHRPWLQRFAALMVVIALTTVTADTFTHAQDQYQNGYSDATQLRNQVSGSIEVRVIRVISDLFLWLAQIQTLIRLFPRRKEKLVIKWVGFVLILSDIIFSCLNSFVVDTTSFDNRPRRYKDAIPALSYLFQLALNLLYAAWVLYFVMTKRRYAFYHHLMPEICVVAVISLLSIVIPVVFFLVDILEPDVSAWGDYFRWVGSAAASIIVWEWVERIEFLEREEKKDGILGREIFEEDDSDDETTPRGSRRDSLDADEKDAGFGRRYQSVKSRYDRVGCAVRRFTGGHVAQGQAESEKAYRTESPWQGSRARRRQKRHDDRGVSNKPHRLSVPAPVATPFDRDEAESPSSTIYAVHYHPMTQTPPMNRGQTPLKQEMADTEDDASAKQQTKKRKVGDSAHPSWHWPVNAFRKTRQSPPMEVKKALAIPSKARRFPSANHGKFSEALGGFSFKREANKFSATPPQRQPTVVPPPARGTPWTPDSIRQATQRAERLSTPHNAVTSGYSDTHDFAAARPPPAPPDTPAGNLSGSTVLNASHGSQEESPTSSAEGWGIVNASNNPSVRNGDG